MFISFKQRVINRFPLETTQITGYPWQSHLEPGTGLAAGMDSMEGGRTLPPRAGLEGGRYGGVMNSGLFLHNQI